MRMKYRALLWLMLLIPLTWPQAAMAAGTLDDEVVFGGTFRLESGETLDGSLIVVGGIATLEDGSIVTGDVILFGGTIQAAGLVEGNVIGLGGLITLDDTAVVEGDLTTIGAHVEQAAGAQVKGEITDTSRGPFVFRFPGGVRFPRIDFGTSPLLSFIWFTFKIFLWAALAVLTVLFLPAHTERVSAAAVEQPLVAGGLGLLSLAVLPLVTLIFLVTIVLIPAVPVLAVVVALAWMLGLVSLGMEVGKRLAKLANQEWVSAVYSGVGTFTLILVLNSLDAFIPCVGWVISALVGLVGLGAVLLTRFGTQSYPLE